MLIRSVNGGLIEIKINDFLIDADYYKEIIRIRGGNSACCNSACCNSACCNSACCRGLRGVPL